MNQFEKKYSDGVKKDVDIPNIVLKKAEEAFNIIKNEKGTEKMKSKGLKKALIGMGSAAALMGAFVCTCVMNPAWASGLPVIGGLFEKYEDKAIYKGNFTEMAEKQQSQTEIQSGKITELPYSKSNGNIEVTIEQLYCNDKAIYGSIKMTSKEGFSTETVSKNDNGPVILSDCVVSLNDMNAGRDMLAFHGNFEDEHTYSGTFRFRINYGRVLNLDDNMKLKFSLNDIQVNHRSETYSGDKIYDDGWEFELNVNIDNNRSQTIMINETNEEGIGLESIEVTPYEMILNISDFLSDIATNHTKYPNAVTTYPVVFDANGKFLECGMERGEEYFIYGKDVAKIDIYLCDIDDYFDYIRGKRFKDNFEDIVKDKALYHKTLELPSFDNK